MSRKRYFCPEFLMKNFLRRNASSFLQYCVPSLHLYVLGVAFCCEYKPRVEHENEEVVTGDPA